MKLFTGVISRRLAISFAILALLTIATALLAILSSQRMAADFAVVQARTNLSSLGSQIQAESLSLINLVQRYLAIRQPDSDSPAVDEAKRLALLEAVSTHRVLLNQLIERAVELTSPADLEERTQLAHIQEGVVNLNLQINRLLDAFEEEKRYGPATSREMETLIEENEAPLKQDIADFQDYEAQRVQLAQEEVDRMRRNAFLGLVLLGLVAAVLAGIMTARSFGSIALPIERLHLGVEKLRQGRLDEPLLVQDTDEIGLLAETLNSMAAQLRQTLSGLEQNVNELKQTQVALQRSEAHYRTLFNGVPMGLYRSSPAGQILDVNDMFAEMLSYPDRETLLATWARDLYLNPEDRVRWQSRVEAEGRVRQFETRLRRYDGSVIWVRENTRLVTDEDGGLLYYEGSMEDITERRRVEDELLQSNTRLAALDAVSRALAASGREPRLAMQTVAQRIAELMGDGCSIHMTVGGSQAMEAVALYHPDPVTLKLMHEAMSSIPLAESMTYRVIQSGQPLRVANLDFSKWQQQLRPEAQQLSEGMAALSSLLLVPLLAQGRSFGTIGLARQVGRPEYTDSDQSFLQELGERVAIALLNTHLLEETGRRLRYVQALRDIDVAITSSLDLNMTLNIMLEQVLAQLRVDAAAVLLVSPHSQVLTYAAGRGFRTNATQRTRVRIGEAYAGVVALRRETVSLPNLRQESASSRIASVLAEEGFVAYYGTPLIAKGQVKGVLEIFHRNPLSPDEEWLNFLETLARQAAIALDNANMFSELQRSNAELVVAYDATIEGWSHALDLRDHETEGHTQRVADLTERLAQAMGLSDAELVHIRRGALLHDIGKMGVPDRILHKPESLTDEEWTIMRQHPQLAYDMLAPVVYLRPVLDIPYSHHENWDGSGYPRSLKGEQIPLSARIFAIADVWDALTSDRPYRPAWGKEKVVEYIHSETGKKFDPQVVSVFLRMISSEL
jgi:PAS domain S-box-containing protein/putative nucleotidyltransferase with HDIG domain